MKIYIENYDIINLESKIDILNKMCNDPIRSDFIIIYSEDGIFKIDENKMQKVNIITDKVYKHNTSSLIVDESKISYENCNYLPYEHLFCKITQFIYKINPTSKLTLVIQGTYLENNSRIKFVPNDFYFETNIEEQIYNPIIKDDLNVFLSLLN